MADHDENERTRAITPVTPGRRQPAGNRGPQETTTPDASEIYPGGDRGERSGVNQEDFDAARGTPAKPAARS